MASVAKLPTSGNPEPGTVAWLNACIERGKSEVFSVHADINPGIANIMLSNNPHNRHLSERKIEQYARDMIEARWTFNGEPIIFGDTGELNDGQHRLQAVIQANLTQRFFVSFGLPRDSRITVKRLFHRSERARVQIVLLDRLLELVESGLIRGIQ